jgi:hypothetical protein
MNGPHREQLGIRGAASVSGREFQGDGCTDDCSGHRAGYAWAESYGITDPDDCGGNSQSFIEGCRAYAEENGDSEERSDDCDDDADDDCGGEQP